MEIFSRIKIGEGANGIVYKKNNTAIKVFKNPGAKKKCEYEKSVLDNINGKELNELKDYYKEWKPNCDADPPKMSMPLYDKTLYDMDNIMFGSNLKKIMTKMLKILFIFFEKNAVYADVSPNNIGYKNTEDDIDIGIIDIGGFYIDFKYIDMKLANQESESIKSVEGFFTEMRKIWENKFSSSDLKYPKNIYNDNDNDEIIVDRLFLYKLSETLFLFLEKLIAADNSIRSPLEESYNYKIEILPFNTVPLDHDEYYKIVMGMVYYIYFDKIKGKKAKYIMILDAFMYYFGLNDGNNLPSDRSEILSSLEEIKKLSLSTNTKLQIECFTALLNFYKTKNENDTDRNFQLTYGIIITDLNIKITKLANTQEGGNYMALKNKNYANYIQLKLHIKK